MNLERVHRPFNRTSLELKPVSEQATNIQNQLLIAPVWNWNGRQRVVRGEWRFWLLIAPVWNWNFIRRWIGPNGRRAFNRTSLELKQQAVLYAMAQTELLIAPVWNWNERFPQWRWKNWTFNRTSLELKHCKGDTSERTRISFNRTSLELKPRTTPPKPSHPPAAFNRTSLELKLGRVPFGALGSCGF